MFSSHSMNPFNDKEFETSENESEEIFFSIRAAALEAVKLILVFVSVSDPDMILKLLKLVVTPDCNVTSFVDVLTKEFVLETNFDSLTPHVKALYFVLASL